MRPQRAAIARVHVHSRSACSSRSGSIRIRLVDVTLCAVFVGAADDLKFDADVALHLCQQ